MLRRNESVLEWMARTGEQPTVREVAELTGLAHGYVSRLMATFVGAGLAWRYRSYDTACRWQWRYALKSDPACHRPLRARWPGPATAIDRYRALRRWGIEQMPTRELAAFLGCSRRRVRQIRRVA